MCCELLIFPDRAGLEHQLDGHQHSVEPGCRRVNNMLLSCIHWRAAKSAGDYAAKVQHPIEDAACCALPLAA